jgi:hypothetical protein
MDLEQPCLATEFFGGDQRRARAGGTVENDVARFGGVGDRPFRRARPASWSGECSELGDLQIVVGEPLLIASGAALAVIGNAIGRIKKRHVGQDATRAAGRP